MQKKTKIKIVVLAVLLLVSLGLRFALPSSAAVVQVATESPDPSLYGFAYRYQSGESLDWMRFTSASGSFTVPSADASQISMSWYYNSGVPIQYSGDIETVFVAMSFDISLWQQAYPGHPFLEYYLLNIFTDTLSEPSVSIDFDEEYLLDGIFVLDGISYTYTEWKSYLDKILPSESLRGKVVSCYFEVNLPWYVQLSSVTRFALFGTSSGAYQLIAGNFRMYPLQFLLFSEEPNNAQLQQTILESADRISNSVDNAADKVSDSVDNAADKISDSVDNAADKIVDGIMKDPTLDGSGASLDSALSGVDFSVSVPSFDLSNGFGAFLVQGFAYVSNLFAPFSGSLPSWTVGTVSFDVIRFFISLSAMVLLISVISDVLKGAHK